MRLTEHPEEDRQMRERYVRALEGIDWALTLTPTLTLTLALTVTLTLTRH